MIWAMKGSKVCSLNEVIGQMRREGSGKAKEGRKKEIFLFASFIL
jgi:hypothetical protein